MTESRIDELLDQHVPAFEPRSDGWEEVLARAHTTRRRYAALAVAALALLLVPTAVALRGQIADLLQGTPAPPGRLNQLRGEQQGRGHGDAEGLRGEVPSRGRDQRAQSFSAS
jgi:hypothetical protein